MYIDFRDPKKIENNQTTTPKEKKQLFSLKNRNKESVVKKDKPITAKQEPLQPANNPPKEEVKHEDTILDKINKVIQEKSIDKESKKEPLEQIDKLINSNSTEDINIEDNTNTPTPPPVPKVGKANFEPFEFRGKAEEFFKIWIVNIALTLLTLGIYSAWAKVRNNRYIYGNTYLNNSNFEYNADPKRIFIGRTIVVAFYALFLLFGNYLGMYQVAAGIALIFILLLPWLIRQAINFKLKSASYRNIPFKFHAKVRSFYGLTILGLFYVLSIPIVLVFTAKFFPPLAPVIGVIGYILLFVVIIPVLYKRYKALVINNASYGNAKFNFNAQKRDVIKVFIKMGFLTFVVSLIFGAIALAVTGMGATLANYLPSNIKHSPYFGIVASIVGMVLYLFFAGLYKGISDGYLSNFTRNHSQLEDAKFKGKINPLKLGWISATNALILIVSLGLLYPWTKFRYLKYKIENTYFACSDYDKFVSSGYETTNAIGEETMDFFDIDIGI